MSQQTGAAQPIGVNTIGYATGSAAKILGLSEGSPGYPGVLYSGAFASSPGNTVRDIGAWLDHFRASVDSSWTSCEIDYSSAGVPDTLANEVQDWATKHPPIQCPASWVTTPPSTPSLLSCIHHESSARPNEASKPAIRVCRHGPASRKPFSAGTSTRAARATLQSSSPCAIPRARLTRKPSGLPVDDD